MKRILTIFVAGLVASSLTACVGKKLRESSEQVENPLVEKVPVERVEHLLWSSGDQRPEWILKEPETIERGMAFVGLSARYSTEQQAREDARRNAASLAAKFVSEQAKEKFERARVSFGLDSSGIDATESSRVYERFLSSNLIRGLKVDEWYEEKWQTRTGIAWKVYALASVPPEAFDAYLKTWVGTMAAQAEFQAREAKTRAARQQAEQAATFWKQMKEQGMRED